MKGGDFLAVGVLVGALYVLAKHQSTGNTITTTEKLAVTPSKSATKAVTPATVVSNSAVTPQQAIDFFDGGGAGGGADYSPTNNGGELSYRMYGDSSFDIFDMLDLWARSSAEPSYREQYPDPPSVIIAPAESE
jgi:hypothetical protein